MSPLSFFYVAYKKNVINYLMNFYAVIFCFGLKILILPFESDYPSIYLNAVLTLFAYSKHNCLYAQWFAINHDCLYYSTSSHGLVIIEKVSPLNARVVGESLSSWENLKKFLCE